MNELVYLDANIFLYAALYENEKSQKAKKLLIEIAEGQKRAITSVLTWDEVVWAMRKLKGIEMAKMEGQKLLKFPNLLFIPVTSTTIIKSQELLEKCNIKPRDSIHAASALMKGTTIITDDEDFDKVIELKRRPI